MSSLEGRTAIVTGASRGIGLATARTLVARGANVCITARDGVRLEEAVESLGAQGRTIAVAGSTADTAHREAVVATVVERFGSLDFLVNNTGINPLFGPLVEADLQTVSRILDTNVVSTLGWIQCAYAKGLRDGGSIVNMGSIAGLRPAAGIGAYAVSKAALVQLTRQLSVELGPSTRVNAIAPGVVRTRFAEPLFAGDEEDVASMYPLRRLGTPEDIGAAVAFLLSDDAAWITGEVLVVDGGLMSTGGVRPPRAPV